MEFTGERVVPGKVEPDLFNEHMARYLYALPLVKGKSVLDLGCGSGYGTFELAKSARWAIGLDVSPEAIRHARHTYTAGPLNFLAGNASQIPVADSTLDVIVSFEVIEHLGEQEQMMREICRVLKPDGTLLISTPNRVFYTEERREVNPYHTREFDEEEFKRFLGDFFPVVDLHYQNHVDAIFVGCPGKKAVVEVPRQSSDSLLPAASNFFLALCAQAPEHLPTLPSLAYVPDTGNLLREQRLYIDELEQRVAWKDTTILDLQKEYEERTQWSLELERQLRESIDWAQKLDEEIARQNERILELQNEVAEKTAWGFRQEEEIKKWQNDFQDRTEWALRLDADLKTCQQNYQQREGQLNDIRYRKIYKLAARLRLLPKY